MIQRIIRINPSDNPAIKFGILLRDLDEIAKQKGSSKLETLNEFLSDLMNYYNEDYEKKVNELFIEGITPNTVNDFISYVKREQKRYMQEEKLEKRKQKQEEKKKENMEREQEMSKKWTQMEADLEDKFSADGSESEIEFLQKVASDIEEGKSPYELDDREKTYMLNKINEKVKKIGNKQKKQEEDILKAQKAMSKIQAIVDREYQEGNITSKASLLDSIKNEIYSNENSNLNVKISKSVKPLLLPMLEDKIKFEKDEMYYEQVKRFTKGFKYFREYPEVIDCFEGHSQRKFTDKESYNRYCSLRKKISRGSSEQYQIEKLLLDEKLNSVDRRILTERKSVMQKERGREI